MRRVFASSVLGSLLLLGATPAALAEGNEKWADHTGDLPFVFGYENGKKEAAFTGKPMMVFFTTTW